MINISLKKTLLKAISNIEWWYDRTSEPFVREEMRRTIDDLKYSVKELKENESE